jgi:hypothetical protein
VLILDIHAAFPSVAKRTLVNLLKVRQMVGDLIPWTKSCLSEINDEMIIEHNAMETQPVDASVPQG